MREQFVVIVTAALLVLMGTAAAQTSNGTGSMMSPDAQPEVVPTGVSTGPTAVSDRLQLGHAEEVLAVSTNVSELLSIYDKNAVLENIALPVEARGTASIKALFEQFFHAYTDVKGHIHTLDIESDGELAFAYSVQSATAKSTNGDKDFALTDWVTDCYRKINGRWLIVYQHLSVPYDPATGKAVINGKS